MHIHMKKLLACLLAGTLLSVPFPATEASAAMCEVTMLGDANNDGSISLTDLVTLQRYLLRQKDTISVNADVNADGSINIVDLCLLKRMLFGTYQPVDFTKLKINEVCASNENCLSDPAGNHPDWVELYNAGEQPLDISGYGLSDGGKKLFKLTFPENTVVPANGYLVVYCDSNAPTVEGALYAPFSISASGETIYLTHPTMGTLDMVEVPASEPDITYGRYANGSDTFSYLSPTPNESNDTAKEIVVVEDPVFSVESGFYDDPFDLSITGAAGTTIYYTLDGSDPSTSDTAKVYNSSLSIYDNTSSPNVLSAEKDIVLWDYGVPNYNVDKGIVIRAVAKDAKGNCSDVISKSYFVGKTASYYQNMKVISLTTDQKNIIDSQTGIYVVGDQYYEWKSSADYDPSIEAWDTRNPTNYNQEGKEWERPAAVEVFEQGTLAYSGNVGIRIAGNATRSNPQKSFRLYARSEYGESKMKYAFFEELTDLNGNPVTSFDKVTIRNGGNDFADTYMRDILAQQASEGLAVGKQAEEPCILFLDGEFWGMYILTEKLEAESIETDYGIPAENVTTIKTYEIEGDQTVGQDYIDFYNWAVKADMTDDANYQTFCEKIDIQSFMDYIAIETYIVNTDWCTPTYTNNWMMWRANTVDESNPYADGKWRYLLYDTEYSSNLYGAVNTRYNYDVLGNMKKEAEWGNIGALFYHLLDNETFKETFYQNYLRIIEENFSVSAMESRIAAFQTEMKEAVTATYKRYGYVYQNYDKLCANLLEFYQKRPVYAKRYLDLVCGKLVPSDNLLTNAENWELYEETAEGSLTVNSATDITAKTMATGEEVWMMQPMYINLTLEAGKTYQFTYTIEGDTTATIAAHIQMLHDPYTTYAWQEHTVTATPQIYTQVFTMPETCNDVKVAFDCGYSTGTYRISNISLVSLSQNMLTDEGNWQIYTGTAEAELTVNSVDSLIVNTTQTGDEVWMAQAIYDGLTLEKGKTYQLTYTLKSNTTQTLAPHVQMAGDPYTSYAWEEVTVTPTEKTYTQTFTMPETCTDTKVGFDCGYGVGTYEITDICLTCLD